MSTHHHRSVFAVMSCTMNEWKISPLNLSAQPQSAQVFSTPIMVSTFLRSAMSIALNSASHPIFTHLQYPPISLACILYICTLKSLHIFPFSSIVCVCFQALRFRLWTSYKLFHSLFACYFIYFRNELHIANSVPSRTQTFVLLRTSRRFSSTGALVHTLECVLYASLFHRESALFISHSVQVANLWSLLLFAAKVASWLVVDATWQWQFYNICVWSVDCK